MPELPEVECVRRSLSMLEGGLVESVAVARRDFVSAPSERERRHPMAGASIERIDRLGKELALVEEGPRRLRMRLGMTGRLLVHPVAGRRAPARRPHEHVRWRIRTAAGSTVLLRSIDPRRFGDLVVFDSAEAFEADRRRLGPDALAVRSADLHRRLAGTRRAIKIALLDQGVLAGVGNIYADEALFASRIHPRTPSNRLDPPSVDRLARAVRRLLRRAIESGGTTIRDYRNGRDEPGTAQRHLLVYGRGGHPCRRCQGVLQHAFLGQRTTVWCSNCQQSVHMT